MFELQLTPEEAELAHLLFTNGSQLPTAWTDEISSSQERLFKLLAGRNAIPDQRRRWFFEPALNIGGYGKSRKQVFESNRTVGNDILRHPLFHAYLHYFIFGPHLPLPLMTTYAGFVESLMKPISSGDVEPLRAEARRLFRGFNCDHSCVVEFHKLALELGLDEHKARSIYDAVRSIR
jgi:hypothetical protein